jgi:hypothetical protein
MAGYEHGDLGGLRRSEAQKAQKQLAAHGSERDRLLDGLIVLANSANDDAGVVTVGVLRQILFGRTGRPASRRNEVTDYTEVGRIDAAV